MKPVPTKPSSAPAAALAAPARARLAEGLHDFARAVRHIHDLNTFLEIFQVGLEKTGVCGAADFRPAAVEGTGHRPDAFASGRLSVPVVSDGGIVTLGQVSPPPDKQHFGAEDLHVLGGLSELLGAALDLAHRVDRNERMLAAVKAVLSFAPVGICAFADDGRVVAINTLARGWLALAENDDIAAATPAGIALADLRRGASFHLRVAGRLLFCESRPQVDGHYAALLVTDLTPEQGRLLDALSREVYRASHLRRSLQFVLLERTAPTGALLAALPALRQALGSAAIVGPYDAARIGVILPETSWSAAILQLRKLAPVLAPAEVRVGRSELIRPDQGPEALIAGALDMPATLADVLKPRILVHDEYRGVADALALVLGGRCDVTASTDAGESHRLLEHQHFDAVLADLTASGAGPELVTTARSRHRGIRAFYLSSAQPGARSGEARLLDDVPVFSKPFDVEVVRDRILAALGAGADEK